MKLLSNRITSGKDEQYATGSDFGALYAEQWRSLYLLSFLLTADDITAWKCFVHGLDDSVRGNPVFKRCARSWARLMIIENAIRILGPGANDSSGTAVGLHLELSGEVQMMLDEDPLIALVLELADFERFVFVISVLEGYPDQDCSALLRCSLQEMRNARTQAIRQIAQSSKSAAAGCAVPTH